MATQALIDAYRYWRQFTGHRSGLTPFEGAALSLDRARASVAGGVKCYPHGPADPGRLTRGPQPWQGPKRFVEDLDDVGARLVGYADEIGKARHSRAVDHKGWYSDDLQSETFRGVVVQFPSRNRNLRLVPGYQESTSGGYVLDLSGMVESLGTGDSYARLTDLGDVWEVAKQADGFAEREAEKAREHAEAWCAGSDYADLGEEAREARQRLLAILAERRAVKDVQAPAICSVIRDKVQGLLDEIAEARRKRAEMVSKVWREYRASFNEGAGQPVFKEV